MRLSDRALLTGCVAGDRDAWEALVRRYAPLVYHIASSAGLSRDDAADVFQTVCLKLRENLSKLRDEPHLTRWLVLVARRDSQELWRRLSRVALIPGDKLDDLDPALVWPASGARGPDQELLRLEERQMTRIALEELPANCRTLLDMLYFSEPVPSYAQIAARMNISLGAIGPTRLRCLQKLKRVLISMGF